MSLSGFDISKPIVRIDVLGGPKTVTGDQLVDALMSLSYRDEPSKLPKFELQFDNTSGKLFDYALLIIGLKMKITFGYATLLSKPFIVPVRKVMARGMHYPGRTVQSPKPDPYGVVVMQAPGYIPTMHWRPDDGVVWHPTAPMPLTKAIRHIAHKYGFKDKKIFIQEDMGIAGAPFDATDESQIAADETIEMFLERKAREVGFVFYVRRGEFHWHQRGWRSKQEEVITYFSGPDLLEFDVEGDYTLNLKSVSSKGINPRKAALVSHIVDNQKNTTRLLATTPLSKIVPERIKPTDIVTAISKKVRAKGIRRLTKHVRNRWKVRLTVVGNPKIFAGSALGLQNFGPVIDGTWYVREVTHTIDDSGYTTTVTMRGRKGRRGMKPRPGSHMVDAKKNPMGFMSTKDYVWQQEIEPQSRVPPRKKI